MCLIFRVVKYPQLQMKYNGNSRYPEHLKIRLLVNNSVGTQEGIESHSLSLSCVGSAGLTGVNCEYIYIAVRLESRMQLVGLRGLGCESIK